MIKISWIIILERVLRNALLKLFKTLQNTYQGYERV